MVKTLSRCRKRDACSMAAREQRPRPGKTTINSFSCTVVNVDVQNYGGRLQSKYRGGAIVQIAMW